MKLKFVQYRKFVHLRTLLGLTAALVAVATTSPLGAQATDSLRLAVLERRIEAVTRELERLQLGRDVVAADSSIEGLPRESGCLHRWLRRIPL